MSSGVAQAVPPFHGNISFNAQHAPFGAFFSFTCGHFGTRGGFGLQIGKPGNQDLYIGVKDGDRYSDAPLKVLPFYEGAAAANEAARYDVEREAGPAEQNVKPKVVAYAKDQIRRHYGWATDRSVTDNLEFTIYTPFGNVPSPEPNETDANGPAAEAELRYRLLPAVVATLRVDNTAGRTTKTGLFALGFRDKGLRLLDGVLGGALGFALRDEMGFAARVVGGDAFPIMRWAPDVGLSDPNPVHLLGNCPGVGFEVPPGEERTLQLVFGVYLDRLVTTRLEGRYFYTRYYANLTDVLNRGLESFDQLVDDATQKDRALVDSSVSPDQQFLIAHATRSYYGSTQLLDVAGQPLWVVNEGEYCMMNTLDLAVDQVFWELEHHPWVVRNLLDTFVHHYSYVDEVKDAKTGKLKLGGIAFCHDTGAHNQFSPFGHSSYELPHLMGCFSYMTAEQLCNWCLIAATYAVKTGDAEWICQNLHTIDACLTSLTNRGGDAGFCQYESSRCGERGAEITTYDSLDRSLAQTRANVYMATKTWATYLGLTRLLERDLPDRAVLARRQAERVEERVLAQAGPDGVLPAVFERDNPGHGSRILPAIEGLIYPLVWGDESALQSRLANALRCHTLALLRDPQRRNVFADGGIKLSSTSNNSWMSKIALFQHICRVALNADDDADIRNLFAVADAAHVCWQTDGSGYWACSDQFVSGVAKGSRYYPRVITAALWLQAINTSASERVQIGKRLLSSGKAEAR